MRAIYGLAIISILLTTAWAGPQPATTVPPFPGTLATARYVYITTDSGNPSNGDSRLLRPEDQVAAGATQKALQQWGKLMLVFRPSEADIVIVVSSWPSEDVLAVYDGHQWPRADYLWRVSGRGGLQSGETPLVTQFENAFESVQKHQ